MPEADKELSNFKSLFAVLDESPLTLAKGEKRIVAYHVVGKNAHDAHLVAAMAAHGITHLLTFNDQDFRRYAGNAEARNGLAKALKWMSSVSGPGRDGSGMTQRT